MLNDSPQIVAVALVGIAPFVLEFIDYPRNRFLGLGQVRTAADQMIRPSRP